MLVLAQVYTTWRDEWLCDRALYAAQQGDAGKLKSAFHYTCFGLKSALIQVRHCLRNWTVVDLLANCSSSKWCVQRVLLFGFLATVIALTAITCDLLVFGELSLMPIAFCDRCGPKSWETLSSVHQTNIMNLLQRVLSFPWSNMQNEAMIKSSSPFNVANTFVALGISAFSA